MRNHFFCSIFLVLSLSVSAAAHSAAGTERYWIEDRPVLLYKLVAWWAYCTDDCDRLCGCTLRCAIDGGSFSSSDTPGTLFFPIPEGYADQVTLPSTEKGHFVCLRADMDLFGGCSPFLPFHLSDGEGRIGITGLDKRRQERLFRLAKAGMRLVLEGPIAGLAGDRVALGGFPEEKLDRPCPQPAADPPLVTLRLEDPVSGKELVRFKLVP